jgi:hypothetical protein
MQSESNIQSLIRQRVGNGAVRLFRNNVGAFKDATGRFIQFGLAKGSADLIGWVTREITPSDVGKKFAQFLSIEVKAPKGKPRQDQIAWCDAVRNAGGIAGIAKSVEDAEQIISPTNNKTTNEQHN